MKVSIAKVSVNVNEKEESNMAKTAKGEAPVSVVEYMEQEMARDEALRKSVDEQLATMRIEQDLTALRERHGLSQAQLARALGVSQPVIAKLEAGKSTNLGIRTLVRTAVALGARVRISIEPDPRAKPVREIPLKVAAGGRRR